MDVSALEPVVGQVIHGAETGSRDMTNRQNLRSRQSATEAWMRRGGNHRSGVEKSVLEVGVPLEQLLTEVGSVFDIFPQTNIDYVLVFLEMRHPQESAGAHVVCGEPLIAQWIVGSVGKVK